MKSKQPKTVILVWFLVVFLHLVIVYWLSYLLASPAIKANKTSKTKQTAINIRLVDSLDDQYGVEPYDVEPSVIDKTKAVKRINNSDMMQDAHNIKLSPSKQQLSQGSQNQFSQVTALTDKNTSINTTRKLPLLNSLNDNYPINHSAADSVFLNNDFLNNHVHNKDAIIINKSTTQVVTGSSDIEFDVANPFYKTAPKAPHDIQLKNTQADQQQVNANADEDRDFEAQSSSSRYNEDRMNVLRDSDSVNNLNKSEVFSAPENLDRAEASEQIISANTISKNQNQDNDQIHTDVNVNTNVNTKESSVQAGDEYNPQQQEVTNGAGDAFATAYMTNKYNNSLVVYGNKDSFSDAVSSNSISSNRVGKVIDHQQAVAHLLAPMTSGFSEASKVSVDAAILDKLEKNYLSSMQDDVKQVVVTVAFFVDKQGQVLTEPVPTIEKSSGNVHIDNDAIYKIREARFKPFTLGDRVVRAFVEMNLYY